VAGGLYWYVSLPDPAELQRTTPDYTELMKLRIEQAKENKQKYRVRKIWAPLRQIAPLLRDAVRVSEDSQFYQHDGFDFDELKDALEDAWREKHLTRGASTISMQLVKNIYLSPSRNPMRKVSEAVLTHRLEESVDKNRILELYLNLIEWGDGVFGIEQAARHWFEESAYTLNPRQVALLAAMLPMPLRVDPRAPNKWLKKRARRLLNELRSIGKLTDEEVTEALREL